MLRKNLLSFIVITIVLVSGLLLLTSSAEVNEPEPVCSPSMAKCGKKPKTDTFTLVHESLSRHFL